jgi:L-lactate permease
MGPFYTCQDHFTSFPRMLDTYEIQQSAILKAKLLATSYKQFNHVDTDYFIAFPCMHIAQPLVVLWFLRRWKKMKIFLLVYDIVLIPAILLLEWHYFADLVGGAIVAVVAILLNRRQEVEDLPRKKQDTSERLMQ